ncbi:unnamed protein product [Chondrus crispus]|uniref:Uncharacterized protein n=1 Tax=Chondrus crispus TaxID=2769 RepID=R7QJZ7_CHOCR|nr:unnamed protein product [Chondrus crispus]CDF38053.1 unnamed protein product [Chondrus crispus]|eukprot:XP_005717922.1 unnamed protein product [Chondrus crispus]
MREEALLYLPCCMDLQTVQTLFHFRGVELWDGITVKTI